MEKALKVGVSFPPDLHAEATAHANERYGGNFSGYIQRLVSADLSRKPKVDRYVPNVLSVLAETYAGYLAPVLDQQLKDSHADQPRVLHDLLVQLNDYLAAGGDLGQMMLGNRNQFSPAAPIEPRVSTKGKITKQQFLSDLEAAESADNYGDLPPHDQDKPA